MRKYKDIIMGTILFAVGLIYFLISFSVKLTHVDQTVGSRMFPQICGVVLMRLSASLAILAVMHLQQPRPETDSVDTEKMADRVTGRNREKHVLAPAVKTLLVLVSFAVFCWLLDKISFAFTAFLYLFSQVLLIAGRKLKVKDIVFHLVLSAVLSVEIYYLFYRGFSLILPKASWSWEGGDYSKLYHRFFAGYESAVPAPWTFGHISGHLFRSQPGYNILHGNCLGAAPYL